ncbi:hypothetical protein [Pseudomonas sp. SWI44]|uniref:hypothetical protein n=1 Tax=Pseudomonas sp. SWI44 TaxID=2083053 RepID=UPI000CE5D2A8|nr:hypothetical protein [Pseudomonas sp. SWI44]AVD86180.1 hypothetical protein C4Q26_03070 [Pseudomonas sp. SWI44]
MALKLNERYPSRFDNPSAGYPQGSFKNRTTPAAKDGSYLEKDWANDKEGFFQRLMLVAGIPANGSVDTALASQYYDALLQVIANNTADTLNAAIASIAVASTVNLTTGAAETSNIVFTGSGTINNFTVAAGRVFIVRFGGAATLTNSASLVTNTGANITAAAGDTCIIRATAANTVEILCGRFLQNAAVGTLGQAPQNVTASRAANTTYTNATGRAISILITRGTGSAGANSSELLVDGVQVHSISATSTINVFTISCVIPAGSTYRLNLTGTASLIHWSEVRT